MSEAVLAVLERLGGVARKCDLLTVCARKDVEAAITSGALTRFSRGTYGLATADRARVAARSLGGTVSHLSAAVLHGWPVKLLPELPHVTLGKNRVLTNAQRRGVQLHRADLGIDDVDGEVTSAERTLLDCLRSEPFESVLRALSMQVDGLDLTPQVPLYGPDFLGRPDLCAPMPDATTSSWCGAGWYCASPGRT